MTPSQMAAAMLLELLEDWVENCDVWERHYSMCANNSYRGGEEKRVYDDIQANYQRPLIKKCQDEGFKYVDLMQMIPPAFRTTSPQRKALLDTVTEWAEKEYDL